MNCKANRSTYKMLVSTSVFGFLLSGSAGIAVAQTASTLPAGDPAAVAANQAAADSAPARPDQTAATPADAAPAIVVTGSRIVRDGYSQPTPVTVAPVAQLQKATPTNLADALNKLPQFSNSSGPASNPNLQGNSGEHGNLLNLRGVGPTRVLILLDGIRVPPTTYRGAVDANTIPQLLVQRVDVVTAGASAAYGSDAVSGVVNYVLDTKFEGLKGVLQKGVSTRGDFGSYRVGVAGGIKFAGDRGHFVFSAERFDSEGVARGDRVYGNDGYAAVGSVPGSSTPPGRPGNPFIFKKGLVQFPLSDFNGVIQSSTVPSLVRNVFLPGGNVRPGITGTPTGTAGVYEGGDGLVLPGSNTLAAPLATTQGYAYASFDATDAVKLHVQGSYSLSKTSYDTQAETLQGQTIYSGNAFLNPALQARLGPNDSFNIFRFLNDKGPLPTSEKTDAYMINGGIDWKVGSWDMSLDYTRGTSITNFAQRQFELLKLGAALDAVRGPDGSIVCRVTLTNPGLYPGCTPINVFGPGTPSQQALDYARGVSRYRARNTTGDLVFNASGNLFELPAGPVAVAVGAQYRTQSLKLTSNSDPSIPLDLTGIRGVPANRRTRFNNTNLAPSSGKLNVKEAYAEVAVPLFKDRPFAEELSVNGAGRITDYSTSGSVKTWKLGAVWKPISDVTFRVTKSRDIRAPSLFELFAGTQSAAVSFTDPHTIPTTSLSIRQLSGGNPNLKPEIGNTFSAGVVLQPRFLPGFSASIDYYDLKIKGAITTQGLSDVVNECENTNGQSPTCDLITRPFPFSDRSPANAITRVNLITQNIAFLRTSGVDFDASYRTKLGDGSLTVRAFANYLDRYVTQSNSIAPAIDSAGHGINSQTSYARPKIKANLSVDYSNGGFSFFVQENMIGKIKIGNLDGDATQTYAVPAIKPVFYTDATVAYEVDGPGHPEFFLTATNLFDRKPPLVPAATVPGLVYPTLFTVYDVVGRTLTAGVRFKL